MSEWTKERIEELKTFANIYDNDSNSRYVSKHLIDALDEIERLQSEVATLRSLCNELIIDAETFWKTATYDETRTYEDLINAINTHHLLIGKAKEITGGNA